MEQFITSVMGATKRGEDGARGHRAHWCGVQHGWGMPPCTKEVQSQKPSMSRQ